MRLDRFSFFSNKSNTKKNQKKRDGGHKRRHTFEMLEQRRVLTAVVATGTTGDDVFELVATGTQAGTLYLNGDVYGFYSNIDSLSVNSGTGTDKLIIRNPEGGLFSPEGGINFVTEDGAGTFENLSGSFLGEGKQGTLSPISTEPGFILKYDSLEVTLKGVTSVVDTVETSLFTFTGATESQNFLVQNGTYDSEVTTHIQTLGASEIDLHLIHKTNIYLNANSGEDVITVEHEEIAAGLEKITIKGGLGADTIQVLATVEGVYYSIDPQQSADDVVIIGALNSEYSTGTGSLDRIEGVIHVRDDYGYAGLYIDDTSSTVARKVVAGYERFHFSNLDNPDATFLEVYYEYGIDMPEVALGAGNDEIELQRNRADKAPRIYGGIGDDTFVVTPEGVGSLQGYWLSGGWGVNQLEVRASADDAHNFAVQKNLGYPDALDLFENSYQRLTFQDIQSVELSGNADGTPETFLFDGEGYTGITEISYTSYSGADEVTVTPAPGVTLFLNANGPTSAPGDVLTYIPQAALTINPPVEHAYGSFVSPGYGTVYYKNFETVIPEVQTGRIVVEGTAEDDVLVVHASGPNSGSYQLNDEPVVYFSDILSFTFYAYEGNDVFEIHNPEGGLFAPVDEENFWESVTYYAGGQEGDTLRILGGVAEESIYSAWYQYDEDEGYASYEGILNYFTPEDESGLSVDFFGVARVEDTVTSANLRIVNDNAVTIADGQIGEVPAGSVNFADSTEIVFINKQEISVQMLGSELAELISLRVDLTNAVAGLESIVALPDEYEYFTNNLFVIANSPVELRLYGGDGDDQFIVEEGAVLSGDVALVGDLGTNSLNIQKATFEELVSLSGFDSVGITESVFSGNAEGVAVYLGQTSGEVTIEKSIFNRDLVIYDVSADVTLTNAVFSDDNNAALVFDNSAVVDEGEVVEPRGTLTVVDSLVASGWIDKVLSVEVVATFSDLIGVNPATSVVIDVAQSAGVSFFTLSVLSYAADESGTDLIYHGGLIEFGDLPELSFRTGLGNDSIAVASLQASTALSIDTGTGSDLVMLGGSFGEFVDVEIDYNYTFAGLLGDISVVSGGPLAGDDSSFTEQVQGNGRAVEVEALTGGGSIHFLDITGDDEGKYTFTANSIVRTDIEHGNLEFSGFTSTRLYLSSNVELDIEDTAAGSYLHWNALDGDNNLVRIHSTGDESLVNINFSNLDYVTEAKLEIFGTGAGSIVQSTGTAGVDTFVISGLGENAGVEISGGAADDIFLVEATSAGSIVVLNGDANRDTFTVRSAAAGSQVLLNGGQHSDTFVIGGTEDSGLHSILGAVFIDGGKNNSSPAVTAQVTAIDLSYGYTRPVGDHVIIDDSLLAEDGLYLITHKDVSGNGSALIRFSTVETVEVRAGTGDNVFDVESTHSVTTRLVGNAGNDTFNVKNTGTSSILFLHGEDGDDVFNLRNNRQASIVQAFGGNGNDLFHLTTTGNKSGVQISGDDGDDYIVVNATGQLSAVNVQGGDGEDEIHVYRSGLDSRIEITGGADNDIVVLGNGTLNPIQGRINVAGEEHNAELTETVRSGGEIDHVNVQFIERTVEMQTGDSIRFNDRRNSGDFEYSIAGIDSDDGYNYSFQRSGGPEIRFGSTESVILQTGAGSQKLELENLDMVDGHLPFLMNLDFRNSSAARLEYYGTTADDNLAIGARDKSAVLAPTVGGVQTNQSVITTLGLTDLYLFGALGNDTLVNNTRISAVLSGGLFADGLPDQDLLVGGNALDTIYGGPDVDALFSRFPGTEVYHDQDETGATEPPAA